MSQILYIVIAVLAFGVIVIIHELGHFCAAKLNGILVEEFSLGMGPRIFGIKGKETQFNVRVLPFGGYVKMLGEDSEVENQRSFSSKAPWRKLTVVIAGPLINVITALILFTILSLVSGVVLNSVGSFNPNSPAQQAGVKQGDEIVSVNGSRIFTYTDLEMELINKPGEEIMLTLNSDGVKKDVYVTPTKESRYIVGFTPVSENGVALPKIATLMDDYPAKEAGLLVGDIITSADGRIISNYEDFSNFMADNNGESIDLTVDRNGAILSFTLSPKKIEGDYSVGIVPKYEENPTVLSAFKYGVNQSISMFKQIFNFFGTLFRGKAKMDDFGGAITVIKVTSTAAQQGIVSLIGIIAFINLNLGIMNILPFPALDGGQIVIFLYEIISRRKANQKLVENLNYFGYMFLMALMVFMIFKDIFFPVQF